MKVFTNTQTVALEQAAMAQGLTQLRLMENAGAAAARVIRQYYTVAQKQVVVVCGPGNNGGDGYVVARKLAESGADVTVIQAAPAPQIGAAAEMYEQVSRLQLTLLSHTLPAADAKIAAADIIVDALFGTGYTPRENVEIDQLICRINTAGGVRISLDLPSGAQCNSGKVSSQCVKAHRTVTFIAYKPCHFLPPACHYCGQTEAVSIGIADTLLEKARPAMQTLEAEELYALLPTRASDAHKFSCGKAAVVAGSYGMAGAAAIALQGVIRSGIGVAYGIVPEGIYPIVGALAPEAVFAPLPQNAFGTHSAAQSEKILSAAQGCDAVLFGPGLGRNADTEKLLRYFIKNNKKPWIIDADGLNALCGCIDIIKQNQAPRVITPHAGEAAKLLGISADEVQANRLEAAQKLAALTGAVTVLKGQYSLIAEPGGQTFVCTRGTPALATAGSGDLLAGMLCCLLAQGLSATNAACLAVFLHATAGELAAARYSVRYVTPKEICEALSELFCQIEANR